MVFTRKRRSVRITVLLMTAVASLVTLSTGIVLFLSGQAAFRNTIELLHASAQLTIERLEDDVRGHVAPANEIVGYISDLVARGDIDPSDRNQMIAAMMGAMAGAPQIAGVVLWDNQGNELRVVRAADGTLKVSDARLEADPELQASIEEVRRTGKPTWRPPAFNRGATYVYVAGPIRHAGTYQGVMVTGVTINQLSAFVNDVGKELGFTAFILYGDKYVLAHPDLRDADPAKLFSEHRPLLPIADLDDAVLRLFQETEPVHDHKIRDVTVRPVEVDGETHLAMSRAITDLGDTPWHVGIYAPRDDLDDQLNRLVGALFAALGVLGVAIVCAVLLARYIAQPIRRIAAASDSVGHFELSNIEPLERSRIKELDEQAVAFNRMLDGLRWFETYVPKTLVNRLIAGHDTSVPSGEMELTVMFTDIIGFTAMTEHMAPADVADMLNTHFEAIGNCIEAENGTLDKYIGDAVMAFWGAPDQQPDHAERACRAALNIAQAVAEARDDGIDHPPIRLKIAVHTGRLLVGNIGARRRMNYTVIGDTVNTCSRIEALCRKFDTGSGSVILVSGDTAEKAGSAQGLRFEDVGAFDVKGRSEQVRVCRLASA